MVKNMIKVMRIDNGVVVEGHANYAPMGQDIVCAGVSALFINLANSINQLTDACVEITGDKEKQILNIKGVCPIDQRMLIELLTDSFFIGIKGISEEYPDYVEVVK